jgi:hypothetical protein
MNIIFIQLYLETLQDLFEPNNNIKIRKDSKKILFLNDIQWIKVQSSESIILREKNSGSP